MLKCTKICCKSPKLLHPTSRIQSQLKPRVTAKSPNIRSQIQYRNLILKSFLDDPIDSRGSTQLNCENQEVTKERKVFFPEIKSGENEVPEHICNDWEARLSRLEKLASITPSENPTKRLEPHLMSQQPEKRADPLRTMQVEAVAKMREKKKITESTPNSTLREYRRVSINTSLKKRRSMRV